MAKILSSRLVNRVIHGIPASFINPDRVRESYPIPQRYTMLFTWTATVGIICPLTQERAVYAVLCMKHRQMLMDNQFNLGRIRAGEQVHHLLDVEVVRRCNRRAPRFQENVHCLVIRDVQGEITYQFRMLFIRVLRIILHKEV